MKTSGANTILKVSHMSKEVPGRTGCGHVYNQQVWVAFAVSTGNSYPSISKVGGTEPEVGSRHCMQAQPATGRITAELF